MRTKTRDARDVREIVHWQRDQLAHAGFSPGLAARIANDPHYDLHALIELVERDCPPELAVRILAPLEGEPHGP